ncbi:hypothetical protein BC833DRAFT_584856 [Globomyces pollinis-pini]|nr:hypothetical protein BC833DRAFT_584856 [Globomyces pollinis-pini]
MPQEEFLNYAKSCHICPNKFKKLHHFYDQLCPNCAEFNYQKRFYSSNMEGRVCIVTGARVKIGYCIALKLLRMGATVIITTRFPHNAAIRYSKEPDFETFAKQLHIYGIDFRDMTMVHQFCSKIKSNFNRMDVIINNAAQTVRKPTQFYKHLILDESIIPNKEVYSKMSITNVYREENGEYQFVLLDSTKDTNPSKATDGLQSVVLSNLSASTGNSLSTVANLSSKLSQVPLTMEDIETQNTRLFPLNVYDRDDQQVDLRKENSWTQEIGNISIVEMFECQVINVIAPWILISELKEMMVATKSLDDESLPIDKYIVNVSAMEGQFYRPKTTCHPHSNMAKASLNMLTRTSASGFAALNIFMTAVDTGWITDENPVDQWEKRENAPPPLDEWDAAMRVLDPVLTGINGDGDKKWGIFLKNYTPTRW